MSTTADLGPGSGAPLAPAPVVPGLIAAAPPAPAVRVPTADAALPAPAEVVAAVFHGATVSDAMPVVVVELTPAGLRLLWGNDAAALVVGCRPADLVDAPLVELLPFLGPAEQQLLLRRERAVRMAMPARTAAGTVTDALVYAIPSPTADLWSLRVVTGSADAERALRATADAHERRFATLTERSPVPTLLSEQGMRLGHVNDAFCRLVGRQADQLLGTGWTTVVHPADLDQVIEAAAAVLEGGQAEAQARLVRHDGSVRTTVVRFASLLTTCGEAGFVGTVEDVTERLAFESRLAHQAHHDPLTGLPNRTRLSEYVTERFDRGAGALACLFLDLDDFKVVNDSLGHAAGDELLVEVATRLRRLVRPTDLVARFGGDEFLVVCEQVDEAGALALAERVATALDRPLALGGVEVRPRASIGVTVQAPEHTTPGDLIQDCDIAMYQAKSGGKGRITVVDTSARAQAHDKLRLVAELREAIEQRSISLVYQPIFGTGDRRPVAVEALARWQHPQRGHISPVVFVPVAEESGLISGLGLLVLDETCRQMSEWSRTIGAAAPQRAAVNVSALQLDASLPGQVESALRRHGLSPSRLTVEITESALMADPRAARQVLHELRELGVELAIDDFGTGYSSLAHLRHLPVTCLKVDRSFVAELSDGQAAITSAIIALAGTLGLDTVAEGVETDAQATLLDGLGATYLQGFGLAMPMGGREATDWFVTRRSPLPAGGGDTR
ncbi:EAL domain-containing protein [Modestobacter sp. I12A-02628]|uniref:EAL domain-containing protein n=1 Tax=Goekera deserti TaxID=2497753 RepID=A0A7K3WLH5_9ACTN|nr:EAL domain-containing protein [Goekera deserti]MPQ97066.1 EAL domain-containing protein [Goekera deserti]NDI46617.1 EAL domain-containing protein [Goekera deserti]NEL56373.1 EAL domain-containing protein [Goekera deserti]